MGGALTCSGSFSPARFFQLVKYSCRIFFSILFKSNHVRSRNHTADSIVRVYKRWSKNITAMILYA